MYNKKHGFTIIETALVMAIAGLILIMAFIALPALQRQARDTKRKDDTMAFLQALKSYQQNNRGQLPSFGGNDPNASSIQRTGAYKWDNVDQANHPWAKFYNQYLGENFRNPDGEKYTFFITPVGDIRDYNNLGNLGFADLYIFLGATCENGIPAESSNDRNLAIMTVLETGLYCADM